MTIFNSNLSAGIEEFTLGHTAGLAGLPSTSCPYPADAPQGTQWHAGFLQGGVERALLEGALARLCSYAESSCPYLNAPSRIAQAWLRGWNDELPLSDHQLKILESIARAQRKGSFTDGGVRYAPAVEFGGRDCARKAMSARRLITKGLVDKRKFGPSRNVRFGYRVTDLGKKVLALVAAQR